jgi:hypothetical protein
VEKTRPFTPPVTIITASKKGGTGKTHLMLTVADMLALNGYPYAAFQADDKQRLGSMIGAKVTQLRPNPDLVMEDPSLLRTSFTPYYEACRVVATTGKSVLLDVGADEVENVANFLTDVDINEDLVVWRLPMVVFVLVQAEPDAIRSAAETIERFKAAVPSAHIVLVENLLERKPLDLLRPNTAAGLLYVKELKPLLTGMTRIVMPGILTDFWEPYENCGMRFLKVLSTNPEEVAKRLNKSVGDVKLSRRAVALYFRAMHQALSQVIVLPKGGA